MSSNKGTKSEMKCLSTLFGNIRRQAVTRVFCLEMSYCNFQRRLPLQGAAASRKTKNSILSRARMFFSAASENPAQATISSDSLTPETYSEYLTKTFGVTGFLHPRYLGDCTEVNALAKIPSDTMGSS